MFSERNRYILKLLLCMAAQPDPSTDYKTVDEWAEEAQIPGPYLSKIVGTLTNLGYLESKKGPSGGVRLRDRPNEILMTKLLNDIDVFDHDAHGNECCVSEQYEHCVISHWVDGFKSNVLKKDTLRDVADELTPVD